MRPLHKVYHRFSIISSPSPPLLLLPSHRHNSISSTTCSFRFSQHRSRPPSLHSRPKFTRTSAVRFHNLVPINALAAAEDGGLNGSASSNNATPTAEREELKNGYKLPPPEIRDIVDAPPLPALTFSPKRDKILFLKRRSLPPLSDLARPEEKLAGMRIDGISNTHSRMSFYTGIGIHDLGEDGTLGPEKVIHGFPGGAKINFVSWSNDGRHLAFTIQVDQEDDNSSKLRLWVANVETGKAKPLFKSAEIYLNAVFDNYVWVNDSTLLVCTIPTSRGSPPKEPLVPPGPKIQSNEQKNIVQLRTYQDLLKDEYDEDLFEYYATSQLVLASLDGNVKPVGQPALYTSIDPSPDEKYLLISSLHKPYSYIVPCGRFPKKVELWTANGKFVRELCDLPLAEDIPIASNSVRKGMRSLYWRPDKPSTLYWVETQDGGDARVEVSPRDIIYTQPADSPEGEQPTILHKLDLRYGGISWCDDSLALIYESWYKTRQVKTWVISPSSLTIVVTVPHKTHRTHRGDDTDDGKVQWLRTSIDQKSRIPSNNEVVRSCNGFDLTILNHFTCYITLIDPGDDNYHGNDNSRCLDPRGISWCDDSLALIYESWYKTRQVKTWVISPGSEDVSPRKLFDRSSEDVYSDPGSPMLRRTPVGTYVIAKLKKENDKGTYVLLNGSGATPQGNVPFLDLFDINTGSKERIWESDQEKYYESVVALMSDQNDGDININQLKFLTAKESKTENTQYYIESWSEKKVYQITDFPHPYPQLASLQKEMIRYQRKDGVQLTATLYLPPGYDPSKEGPLPCLVWSYPGEFKNKEAAGQVRGSPNEFAGIGPTSPLLWLTRRFAVLSGPTIPIIGEGEAEANDSFVEQLVASAEAAVEEVIRRGVAHPDKIAVGGHSYGAFMTANLLAHAPHLFSCGIARSGAYNRTLTPFGFQNEERTLWDATSTYIKMSPFMSANKIKKPILLIHGEEDNNPGTLTMQSDRFFNALKGHGALSRLVVLPYESHGYSARESIMHVLWETDRWLQKYCVPNTSEANSEVDADSDGKAVASAGRVP